MIGLNLALSFDQQNPSILYTEAAEKFYISSITIILLQSWQTLFLYEHLAKGKVRIHEDC